MSYAVRPTHHTQFDLGYFVLVPSPNQQDLMKRHELQDFAKREEIIRSRGRDPGQTFPEVSSIGDIVTRILADTQPNVKLSDEFEYIPIRRGAYRIHLHNPTPYDQHVYHFDNADHWPCPLLHFKASHIALMLVSGPYLANRARFQSLKADIAESEVLGLLKLYQRRPFLSPISTTTVSAQYGRIPADLVELLNTLSSASVFSSSPVPVSQPLESRWH